ncbi:MAG: hypothetical protein CGW95_08770 [Phenylobacterium zucineum]|nr:MAG: hypothetical protein CGW95_08770 [Phenylobacterium zucineum]
MRPDQKRPLEELDTLSQTVGCRHSNPDICRNHSTENQCAFARPDNICKTPPRSWSKIYNRLHSARS